ncbi:MAG TPA: TonB-dependent receptor [Polyangia bacterium]
MIIVTIAGARAPASARADAAAGYETVVIAPRPSDAAGERHIDAGTMATTPVITAEDLLRLVPGLLATRHGAEGKGRQLFLRGFDAAHGADVEVTVDDVPWNELSNVHGQGYLDLQLLIPEVVRAIDAAKGAFRLEQGPFATAASVRFSLGVAPENRGVRVAYDIGSTQRHRAVVTAAAKQGPSFVAAEALRDAGYGTNRATRRAGLIGKLGLLSTAFHELELVGGGHLSRFGEPGTVPLAAYQSGRVGFYDSLSPDTGGQSDRAFLALRWRWSGLSSRTGATWFATGRRLQLQDNFTGHFLEPERGDRLEQRHLAWGGGLRVNHERPLGPVVLLAGASARAEHIDQREDRIDAQHIAVLRVGTLRGWLGELGGRVGARWLPVSAIKLEAGLRLESFWFDVTTPGTSSVSARRFVWLPRVATTVYATEALTATLGYGRGVRPPEARAFTRAAGASPDPTSMTAQGDVAAPVIADGAEAGLRWRPRDWLDVGLGGFATFIEREQIFDHVAGTNLAREATRRVGGEVDVTVSPRPWLWFRIDGTAVDARFVDADLPVPGAPTLYGALEGHLLHPQGWNAGARVMALGSRPLALGARAGAAFITDVMTCYRGAFWDLSLTVENLTGARWREGEFNYASWFDRTEPRSAVPRLHFAAGPPRVVHLGLGVRH